MPVAAAKFEAIGRTALEAEGFELDSVTAESAFNGALADAEKQGLQWHKGSIELQPREDLLKLVAYSDKAVSVPQGE